MPPIEILAYETTSLGTLCLRRRELVSNPGTMVTEVTLNHEFLMSSYLTESERVLCSSGLKRIDSNDVTDRVGFDVLVGGLGLGYTAFEALKSPRVARVEVVEFLPQVIGWTKDGLVPLSDELNSAINATPPRMQITPGDIYERLANAPSDSNSSADDQTSAGPTFDLIAIDVDHSPEDVLGSQSSGFYSEVGLSQAALHLNNLGVIAIWSYASDTPLLDNMKKVFDDVAVEQVTVFNDLIKEDQTDWLFFGRRR